LIAEEVVKASRILVRLLPVAVQTALSICEKCGGEAKLIASIEDQVVIDKIPSLGP
jgi:hypothetical protein